MRRGSLNGDNIMELKKYNTMTQIHGFQQTDFAKPIN